MLEQLRKENQLLHDDNAKLVTYIESLPPTVHVPGPNVRVGQALPPGGTPTSSTCLFFLCFFLCFFGGFLLFFLFGIPLPLKPQRVGQSLPPGTHMMLHTPSPQAD
jgi:hypothetical protein